MYYYSRLPSVLIQLIYHYLDLNSFLLFARCNRELYRIGDTDTAWKQEEGNPVDPWSGSKFARIVFLDSSHCSHLSHPSLIRSHAAIHYDLCHDSIDLQAANYLYNRATWKFVDHFSEEREIKYNCIELELRALFQVRHLTSVVVGGPTIDGMRALQVLRTISQHPSIPDLKLLVLGVNCEWDSALSLSLSRANLDLQLDLSTFRLIIPTLSSLTILSLDSIFYSIGQLALCEHLPLLHSLHLTEQRYHCLQSFDLDDLCTVGRIPQLTSLSLSLHNHIFTPTALVRLLQQPRLKTILQSFAISRTISDQITQISGDVPQFELHHILEAWDGFINLKDLHLFCVASPKLHHCILNALLHPSSLGSSDCGGIVNSNSTHFLPSLIKLTYHGVDPDHLPDYKVLKQFLIDNKRHGLSIALRTHIPLKDQKLHPYYSRCLHTFGPLVKYPQFLFSAAVPWIPNIHVRHWPTLGRRYFSSIVSPLTCLGWLRNTLSGSGFATAVRTEFGHVPESYLISVFLELINSFNK